MSQRTDPSGLRSMWPDEARRPLLGWGHRPPRPPEGFGLRKVLRGTGKTLISVGLVLFLFVAYQLWGTGITERREQKALAASFERKAQLLSAPPTLPLPGGAPGATGISTATTAPPPPELGDAAAMIQIPKIDVEKWVVEGVGVEELKGGPGHYPDTPMPGERGNAAIAGHRTTYGAPFYRLNELNPGDAIVVTTHAGRFNYEVMESRIVDPDEVSVLNPTTDDRLTLTTCHPRFSAANRLIVVAKLTTPPVEAAPRAEALPVDGAPATARPENSAGLSGAHANKSPAIIWALFAAAIWAAGWLFGRAWRRWPAYALTTPVFLVVSFFLFENVARLLPANV